MVFDEFLKTHQMFGFVWEIFKGIAPTCIALITIAVNTHINKKKAKREELSSQIKELQLMASDLSPYILNAGKNMLDSIQHLENKEQSEALFAEYEKCNSEMLIEARKFLTYANIRAEIWEMPQMNFSDACETITKYSYEVMDIVEWYNQKASVTPIKQFDNLCDLVQKKMIEASNRAEGALIQYCVGLKQCFLKQKKKSEKSSAKR
ncbi:MAG: hypothetical protein PUB46_00080 [Lachnospiraceae bacterium]|nr:hypothetical protein [Lachnospiraceae bacterium]